jgi:hypothetical protein
MVVSLYSLSLRGGTTRQPRSHTDRITYDEVAALRSRRHKEIIIHKKSDPKAAFNI